MSTRKRLARRFGWLSLSLWALGGLALESLHGWKASFFLDDPLTHQLLTLGHAHGVGLALVVLVFGEAGTPCFGAEDDRGALRCLISGSTLVPSAFVVSAWRHPEGDPNLVIWLVPLGAALVLYGLATTARASFTNDGEC